MEVFIRKVEIKNFQSHEQTNIDFKEGINVISGSSNNGKSAILRAIQWVVTNSPGGQDFITIGKDECSVSLTLSNGNHITRTKTRSGNVNTYTVRLHEALNDTLLTGFGSGVPLEVREALGITRPEYIFASQLEAPFLISETPKVRAERIGNLDELGKIDKALTDVNDDMRLHAKQTKSLDVEIKKDKKELENLQLSLTKERKILHKINAVHQHITQHVAISKQLQIIIQRWIDIEQTETNLQSICEQAERIVKFYPEQLPQAVEELHLLLEKQNRLAQIETELSGIKVINDLTLTTLIHQSDEVEQQTKQFSVLERIKNNLTTLKLDHQEAKRQVNNRVATIDLSSAEYQIEQHRKVTVIKDSLKTQMNEMVKNKQIEEEAERDISNSIDALVVWLQTEQTCPVCAQDTKHIHLTPEDII